MFWVTQKNMSLTHFMPLVSFDIPWKYQKARGHDSFHIWWKKKSLKHKKVSRYYEHDCLQKYPFLFMYLLTVLILKNSHILAGIYFIFLYVVLHWTICVKRFVWFLFVFEIVSYKSEEKELNAESCYDFAICTFRLVELY